MITKIFLPFLLILSFSFSPKQKKWVAIGDSITYLNDHPNETAYRVTKGYLTLVTEKLSSIHYVNKGFNGWTAVEIASKFDKLSIPKGDIYTVFLGTNDWWASKPLGSLTDYQNNNGTATVNGSFRVILDKIKQLNPDAKIILITPMKRVDFVYINQYTNNALGSYKTKNGQDLEAFANAIVKIGSIENIPVVDLYHLKQMEFNKLVKFKWVKDPSSGAYKKFKYPDFIDVPFNPNSDEYPYPPESIDVTFDGLHPSDKGYKIIASEVIKIMRKFIE